VAQAERHVRLHCNAGSFELCFCDVQGCNRDNGISRSVDQQDRRLCCIGLVQMMRIGQHSRVAHYRSNPLRPTQTHMQCHHSALAKTDYREIGFVEPILIQLAVYEVIDRGSSRGRSRRKSLRMEARQSPPLISSSHHSAELRGMRRKE